MIDYNALLQFANEYQTKVLKAVLEHGSHTKAGKALNVDRRSIDRCIKRLKTKATLAGYSPEHDMTHPAPDGYMVKGVSTLHTPDGVAAQWVKTDVDKGRMLAIAQEVVEAMSEDITRERPVKRPAKRTEGELLNLYTITDFHLGMMAWHEETGADYDTAIAEDLLVGWFAQAIASSPAAERGVLAQLGDFLHWDGMDAVTPEHRNLLDADTRFEKLVRVAIRALRRVVRMLLEKHDKVHIIMAEGNHDPASSVWLREWFAALYENEPRVSVDQSPDPYYCVEHGDTSLFFHHGHKRKAENVADVFAAKYRDTFGRTKHSYAHLGHRHETKVIETNLMVVEQHRTLASPDAYASRGGWMSGRGASVITYSAAHGEVGRVVVGPEMCQTS